VGRSTVLAALCCALAACGAAVSGGRTAPSASEPTAADAGPETDAPPPVRQPDARVAVPTTTTTPDAALARDSAAAPAPTPTPDASAVAPRDSGAPDVGYPPASELPVVRDLPDPFVMNGGARVRTRDDWARRREEIKALLLYYEYGRMPPTPDNVTVQSVASTTLYNGAATQRDLALVLGGGKVKVRLTLIVPAGRGPFPVIIRHDPAIQVGPLPIPQETVTRGYMIAVFNRLDVGPEGPDRTVGVFPLYPQYDWATLAAWAWGAMRVVDHLMTLDYVDKKRIVITGHSRGGKVALLAGALDERIALVAPNGSGAGGAGCYRVQGTGSETLTDITDGHGYWFQARLREFGGKETRLPFDQHFLRALVAPRPLLTTDALGDLWANPLGTQTTYRAAKVVYDFLGAGDKIGISYRDGDHAQTDDDWRTMLDFADLQLFGKAPASGRRFDVLPFPQAPKAFDWTAPAP
jgi:hypothetical protein